MLKADEAGGQVATSVAPLLLLWALKQKWVGWESKLFRHFIVMNVRNGIAAARISTTS